MMAFIRKLLGEPPKKGEMEQARAELRQAVNSTRETAKKASQDQINTMAEAIAFRSARR